MAIGKQLWVGILILEKSRRGVGRTNLMIFEISCPWGNVINNAMLVLTLTSHALCLLIISYVPKENTKFLKV